MTVTEFALFTLRDSYDPLELLETVMESQEIQDEWVRAAHPNICAKRASISRFYTHEPSSPPHCIAITAPWASRAAHHEWIDTAANKGVMAKFAAFLPGDTATNAAALDADQGPETVRAAAAAAPGFVFFHMDSASRRATHLHDAMGPHDPVAVTRIAAVAGAAGRTQLQARYDEVEEALAAETPRDKIWAGWRIEKDGEQEELVVFRNARIDADKLAPLMQYGTLIDRELRITEIAPQPAQP